MQRVPPFLPLLICSVILFSCIKEEIPAEGPTPLELNRMMTIESSEGSDDLPILPFVNRVAVASDGTIFILTTDGRFETYDADGNWTGGFGRSGAGPGEFSQISAIFVDSDDRLIVADSGNDRLTILNRDGDLMDTISSLGIGSVRSIRQFEDGRFLLTGYDGTKLIHIFDHDLRNREASFGSVSDFSGTESAFEQNWLGGNSGHAYPLDEERIAFVPSNYQGLVYIYSNQGGEWALSDQIAGYRDIGNGVTFYDRAPSDAPVHAMVGSPAGTNFISYKSYSYGFFRSGEELVHISYETSEGGMMNLVAEVFDTESVILTRFGIDDSLDVDFSLRKQPFWMNGERQIYLTDNSDIPRLKVLQLRFSDS